MKLKFADPESIEFMKKGMAMVWFKRQKWYILEYFEEHSSKCPRKRFDKIINKANDVYFWFTVKCPVCKWEIIGTVVYWQKKKWIAHKGHKKPTTKERKGQLLFEGC